MPENIINSRIDISGADWDKVKADARENKRTIQGHLGIILSRHVALIEKRKERAASDESGKYQ